jgi:UDPglucose 6-dehydrogenase
MKDVAMVATMRDAVAGADVVVLVTRWKEFSGLKGVLQSVGQDPLVVDGRRVLEAGDFKRYEGIGRGAPRS